MHEIMTQMVLLGRGDFFEANRRHALHNSQISFTDLAMAALIFVAFAVLLYFLSKVFSPSQKPRGVNSPWRLFWNLCRAHGLRLPQCWLLWRIARDHQLKDPALLFVEPELLDVDILGTGYAGKAAEVELLHGRLFAGLAENDAG